MDSVSVWVRMEGGGESKRTRRTEGVEGVRYSGGFWAEGGGEVGVAEMAGGERRGAVSWSVGGSIDGAC